MQDTNLIDGSPNSIRAAIPGLPYTFLLVFGCFTLASSGFLAWLYHLMELAEPGSVEALTTGGGYLCQSAGVLVAAALLYLRPQLLNRRTLIAALVAHLACALVATTGATLAQTLAFGYAMSVLCGFVSAFYLAMLARLVPKRRRGTVFGCGYACSTVATWLLSMAPTLFPAATGISNELVWCGVFSALVACACAFAPAGADPVSKVDEPDTPPITRSLVVLACITVVLMSMMKGIGGGFPSADIGTTVDLESSRLLYAAGLVIAGLVIDRSRKSGVVLCLAALFVPFALLALSGEPVPSAVLWSVDYLFFGFFSVFRIVLFADLAADDDRLYLSGFGLMFGRIGDALGTFACLALGGRTVILVVAAAVLFVTTVIALARLAQVLYLGKHGQDGRLDKTRLFDEFANRYDLSRRERDVLELVLKRHTNPEMAEMLVVSENTVKFHMRNILQKTGCANRKELLAKYGGSTPAQRQRNHP